MIRHFIGDRTLSPVILDQLVNNGASVPEPSTITILGSGLGMLFFVVRRRRLTRSR